MLDRKAWVVLSVCGVLLAVNMHFAQKNAEALKKEKEAGIEKVEKSADPNSANAVSETDQPGRVIVEEPDIPAEEIKEKFIDTGKVRFELSTLTGGLNWAEQKEQMSSHDEQIPVRLNLFAEQSIGTLTDMSGNVLDNRYVVKSADSKRVTFLGQTKTGLTVEKTWTRGTGKAGDYQLRLEMKIANPGDKAVKLGDLGMIVGTAAPLYERELPTYLTFFWQDKGKFTSKGASMFEGGFFKKGRDFYNESKEELGFAGVENQFFATIVSPVESYSGILRAHPDDVTLPPNRGNGPAKSVSAEMSLSPIVLPAGEARTLTYDVYMGPKLNSLLRSIGEGKGEVMNYGWFSWISRGLNWVLNGIHGLIGARPLSWGLAIIFTTLMIRVVIWPLHAKSTRTMKRMSKLQPKMKALKEKYPDDANKLNQETMKLYRDFGVNPMGGCLPMLAQIPIFFGFFSMLRSAVELRNESFLWVHDLSLPDTLMTIHLPFSLPFLGQDLPVNILPILMAITMLIQMAITPKTGDKMQQRLFMLMPLMFFFFCYNFASALALYWTTQNIFSIAQTYIMQKMPEPELKANKKKKEGPGWMEKLQQRAEEAQRIKKQGGGAKPATKQAKPKKPRGPRTGG